MPFELIIAQCIKLQPQAQMAFYRMFYEQVFQRSYAILKDTELAEEIMQDALLKILQQIKSFKGDAKAMQKLLNRIAVNQSIDILRRRKKILFVENETFSEIAEEERDVNNEEELIETSLQHLNTLSDGYRMVITMRIFEEMTFEEIGENLNINTSTARSQYVRGVKRLRELIINK